MGGARRAAAGDSDDPRYPEQWNLPAIGAPSAWQVTAGDPAVTIAVLDTGVAFEHPDLAPNIWTNPDEIPANGVDDDDNGLIDDARGWDFVEATTDPRDLNGHGTHVAAIAGGRGDNGAGVAGVAWRARIMPLRVLDQEQGRAGRPRSHRRYAYTAREGTQVANLSLSGRVLAGVDEARCSRSCSS